MPGCAWWTIPKHETGVEALTEALGPAPYKEGIAGYLAIAAALEKTAALKSNASVKALVAKTVALDRYRILAP